MDKKQYNKEFGKRMRMARYKLGYPQSFIADQLGISKLAVSRIENGKQNPPLHLLTKLSHILGIPSHDLTDHTQKALLHCEENDDVYEAYKQFRINKNKG